MNEILQRDPELHKIYNQLDSDGQARTKRFLTHIVGSVGFHEAWRTFKAVHGGLENLSLEETDRFMDEWESSVQQTDGVAIGIKESR